MLSLDADAFSLVCARLAPRERLLVLHECATSLSDDRRTALLAPHTSIAVFAAQLLDDIAVHGGSHAVLGEFADDEEQRQFVQREIAVAAQYAKQHRVVLSCLQDWNLLAHLQATQFSTIITLDISGIFTTLYKF